MGPRLKIPHVLLLILNELTLLQLKEYIRLNKIRYPAVVLDSSDGSYTTVMTSADLNACAGDPNALLEELQKKDVLLGRNIGTTSL